ncbi:MAG: hypothetical protein RIG26_15025 [Thalassospira sp.]|uniref:hypothetical protein n=1 Tax=Thalassospira sp. TaxID=1912094 RepID=UPI0032EAEF16
MDPSGVDQETFRWTLGGVCSAFTALFGWLWLRQNGDRDKASGGDDKIWTALNKLVDQHHELERSTLQNMATKSDLSAMEGRIMSAIKEARAQQ